ncbi:MAG TPA: hypothetical protein VFA40_22315 [Terriglobales bacterium]|jgi:uncharacterized membrane protein|nr:hypothetical protein [Terriglobales bacterium]
MRKTLLNKIERDLWLIIAAVIVLATALAVAWYVYIPDAPHTERGRIQR